MITAAAPTPAVAAAPKKKTVAELREEYIACLLGEIIAYQVRERAWCTLIDGNKIPDRDLKAAKGATNHAKDLLQLAEAEERAAK